MAPSNDIRLVTASREVAAHPAVIFDLIADPARQPEWDGNDNLAAAATGQRVRAVGDVFVVELTNGGTRHNHVVDFVEGERIAWLPSEPGQDPPGHRWAWTLDSPAPGRTLVTHTYDWRDLTDETRLARARATTADALRASLDRLAALAESDPG